MRLVASFVRMPDLSDAENERIRAALLRYMEREQITKAECARRIGVSQPTLSVFMSGNQGMAFKTSEAVAKLLGVEHDELLGKKRRVRVAVDAIHPVVAEVAKARGFSDEEAEYATASLRGFAGFEMTEAVALDLLEKARVNRRDVARMLGVPLEDAGGDNPLADFAPRAKRTRS